MNLKTECLIKNVKTFRQYANEMTTRTGDLTVGGITSTLLRFTLPMMLGSLMQQCYNIADDDV